MPQFRFRTGRSTTNPAATRGVRTPHAQLHLNQESACSHTGLRSEDQPVEWLWDGLIPLGMLTLIYGDLGLGKSTMTACLAAWVTRNDDIAEVLIANAEDSPEATIVPRLRAADADFARVGLLSMCGDDGEYPLSLPNDIDVIRVELQKRRAEGRPVCICISDRRAAGRAGPTASRLLAPRRPYQVSRGSRPPR